ncbi:MAG: methylenetetrahydrofolate reductase C-terminal domain-containing protein [Desulfomonilaceae bacterium]
MKLFHGSTEANFLLDLFSASIEPLFRIEADNKLAPICDKTDLLAGCMGGALQVVRQATEELGLTLPVKIALDSVGHMDTVIAGTLAREQCQECGECVLNETGGICPVTKCAKSLLNGPCGGAENGKCEVDRDRDCAWILIYNRLAALGELDSIFSYKDPKDYAKFNKPRSLRLAG